jgi:formylglycine-generating enzyme required for sulfatase activity
MTLVLIPAGGFTMGSPDGVGAGDEHPQQERRFSKPFYLGVHEVTQGQYLAVMGKNPSWFSANGGGKEAVKHLSPDQHPVEFVSWFDALRFCNLLSEQEGIRPFYTISQANLQVPDWDGPGYRLPTETEWEYACRADGRLRYSFGDEETELSRHGWFGEAIDRGPHPVGRKQANPWGLFDMHGNVWEWCWDWYAKDAYAESAPGGENGPKEGVRRVRRGGGFSDDASDLRSAARASLQPATRSRLVGFRVARNVP